jgi:transposase
MKQTIDLIILSLERSKDLVIPIEVYYCLSNVSAVYQDVLVPNVMLDVIESIIKYTRKCFIILYEEKKDEATLIDCLKIIVKNINNRVTSKERAKLIVHKIFTDAIQIRFLDNIYRQVEEAQSKKFRYVPLNDTLNRIEGLWLQLRNVFNYSTTTGVDLALGICKNNPETWQDTLVYGTENERRMSYLMIKLWKDKSKQIASKQYEKYMQSYEFIRKTRQKWEKKISR